MIVVWHMLILYDFSRPKHFIRDPKPKSKIQNLSRSVNSDFSEIHSDRSTGCRPALDRHAQVCMWVSVDRRSTDTLPAPNLLLSGNTSRPTQSTGEPQRSDFWPLAVDRPGRPSVKSSDRSNSYFFLADSLLGFDTNDFVRLFLTPINRGSPHIDKTIIFTKKFQKIFQSLNSQHPTCGLHLYFSLALHYTIPYIYIYIFGSRIVLSELL